MIKFFRIFINMLYAFFTMGMIAIIAWGANWMVNTGGESYDVPNLIANKDDDPSRTIYFSDIIEFDGVSISNAARSHEIFIGDTDEYIFWRAINVRWLNTGLTWVKNVTIAILSPSFEIEQMGRYRYASFVTRETRLNEGGFPYELYVVIDSSNITLENYKYLEYDIYGILHGSKEASYEVGQEFTYEQVKELGAGWKWAHEDDPDVDDDMVDEALNSLYNEVSKFDKYNREEYAEFDKFLVNKPVVKWAFAEIIIIIIITGFVVYQAPIDFTKTESGVTEINKTFFPRIPLPRRRIPKRYREDYEEERKNKHRR